jgi:hypothetical protein
MADLTQCTAKQLLGLYRSGQASPVEATQAVLERIARLNPLLNAFCWVDETAAMASAHLSEARWQAHRHSGAAVLPLDGVPLSIKDLILTQGWPTLRGSKTVNPDQPWEVDAPVSARLRESGAVLLGKTTTPEFGCKGETNSLLTGISRNPWNTRRFVGWRIRCGECWLGTLGHRYRWRRQRTHSRRVLRQCGFETQLWPCASLPLVAVWLGGPFGSPRHDGRGCGAVDEHHRLA